MLRVKRGTIARMKRKKILKFILGFKVKRRCLIRISKTKVMKALSYSYVGRNYRKHYFKSTAIARINAFFCGLYKVNYLKLLLYVIIPK